MFRKEINYWNLSLISLYTVSVIFVLPKLHSHCRYVVKNSQTKSTIFFNILTIHDVFGLSSLLQKCPVNFSMITTKIRSNLGMSHLLDQIRFKTINSVRILWMTNRFNFYACINSFSRVIIIKLFSVFRFVLVPIPFLNTYCVYINILAMPCCQKKNIEIWSRR